MNGVGIGSFAVFVEHWDFAVAESAVRIRVKVVRVVVIVSVHGRSQNI